MYELVRREGVENHQAAVPRGPEEVREGVAVPAAGAVLLHDELAARVHAVEGVLGYEEELQPVHLRYAVRRYSG